MRRFHGLLAISLAACAAPLTTLRPPTAPPIATISDEDCFEYTVEDRGVDPPGDDWSVTPRVDVVAEAEWAPNGHVTVNARDEWGVDRARLRIEAGSYAAFAARSENVVAVAFGTSTGLAFASTTMEHEYVVLDEQDLIGPRLAPEALVATPDGGWWIVARATWQEHHFAWAEPEWRFLRIDAQGRLVGRVHARFGWDGTPENVHVVGNELRALFEWGRGHERRWHALAVVPRASCPPVSTDPCDPEVHRRTSTAPTIAEGEWSIETEGTEATIVRYLVRRSSDHVVRWRAPLGGRVEIGGPVVNDDRVFAVTVGLGEYLHDADRDVALHTLDAATGTRTTEQSLPSTGAISACVGELGSAVIVGIAGRSGLALVNADGEPSWSTNEEWSSCALASLARNVVIAARRIDGVMSGGFLTTLVLHVVTHDGQLVETLELPERGPGDVAIRADENGAWLSWASGLWERKVLRLDSQGHPDGEPRSIGTLYFFPDTRLVTTSRGPSLAWSTAHEEGLIPLCWTEPEPPELVVPRSEAWP